MTYLIAFIAGVLIGAIICILGVVAVGALYDPEDFV